MLKRYQVLLDEWMAAEAKKMAKRYDMSFSEVVRASLCSKYLECVKMMYPKYKPSLDDDTTKKILNCNFSRKVRKQKTNQGLSRLYFETKKAIEYFEKQEQMKASKKEK